MSDKAILTVVLIAAVIVSVVMGLAVTRLSNGPQEPRPATPTAIERIELACAADSDVRTVVRDNGTWVVVCLNGKVARVER